MFVLSVDPGIRGVGAALWSNGTLVRAAYVRNPSKSGSGPRECYTMAKAVFDWVETPGAVGQVVVEWPQTYQGRAAKGDANDLFALAGVDAAIVALFPDAEVKHYLPRAWKGTMDGDVMIERIKGRLSADEMAKVDLPAPSLQHNVFDGAGVGLAFLNRLDRKRVFARE